MFGVGRNEEMSHDEPHIWTAMEHTRMALPWEVMTYINTYTAEHE